MIRVIVADDSRTARELLRSILEADGDITVVAEAHDGVDAVARVIAERPDLVIMDVHMPLADGLDATREIMMRAPTPIVIVSSMAQRDVDLSLTATQAGALLALPKPEGPSSPHHAEAARELRQMVRAMAHVKLVRRWGSGSSKPAQPGRPWKAVPKVEMICIAASTGGPAAYRKVLLDLPRDLPVPVVIVQHIARGFTAGFADWLGTGSPLPVTIAVDGVRPQPATVYVAPDDAHLGISGDGVFFTSSAPHVSGFRPSASVLFESAGACYRNRLVALVMTGMGTDGADGLESARRAGAYVIAQDEASSVVFGMAGEAVRRGAVDAVLPLDLIPRRLVDLVTRDHNGRR